MSLQLLYTHMMGIYILCIGVFINWFIENGKYLRTDVLYRMKWK